MRLLIIFLVLAAIVLAIFFVWGDSLMTTFSQEGTIGWLGQYGDWAWIAAIVLLMADLLLPLPATLVMSALGYIYGPVIGGLISAAGSLMAGSLGYWLCRSLGEKAAIRLLGAKDYSHGKNLSNDIGGWVVVLSRWLPVFPEVISCMAGLTRMRARYFHVALLCGSLPLGFTYAFVGSTGISHPAVAIGLSAGLPPLIWIMVRWYFRIKLKNQE
ncbi:MAG: VTT domain-containing protein [Cyclobacteriaceae bacterium]|nr:VTT domain-containing protein [Cyclobacteriaceae bacterium]